MAIKPNKFRPEEYERAYDAYAAWKVSGETDLICLHCQTGQFEYEENGSSVKIKCTTPSCVVTGIRGI